MESQQFTTTIEKTTPGKNRQQKLNLDENFDKEQDIHMILKFFPTDCLLQLQGKQNKTKTLNSMVEKSGNILTDQVTFPVCLYL